MNRLKISDPTLRDGNHAVSHQLNEYQLACYLKAIDQAGVDAVEVGHGNGLGASSFQIGKSHLSDREMLSLARQWLKKTKLSVHVIPGFATIDKDIKPAIDLGVDLFRIASHCTEPDLTETHIQFLRDRNIEVYGVLMMSHMISKEGLVESAKKLESYGAQGIIIMDSAGAYLPGEVKERISALCAATEVEIGFHAHNNLGLAIANTLAAIEGGATIVDATARGFGAGAGNCQLEVLIPVLQKLEVDTGVDFYSVCDAAEIAERELLRELPFSKTMSIVTGLAGIFSGYAKQISRLSSHYLVDYRDVVLELGRRKVIAGQEDMILDVVQGMIRDRA